MSLVRELGEEVDGPSPVHVGHPRHLRKRKQQQVWESGAEVKVMGSHHLEDLLEMQEGKSCPGSGREGSSVSHSEVGAELGPLFPAE